MDDLNGLEWTPSSTSKTTQVPPAAARGTGNYYASIPSLAPTPIPPIVSRNGTPQNAHGSSYAPPKPQSKPATDSFAGLTAFGARKETLSLKEQQEKLQAEQRKAEEERRKKEGNVFSFDALEDDDPFGLNKMKQPATNGQAPSEAPVDDFDFLGDLARPVEEIQKEKKAAEAEATRKRQQAEAEQKRRAPTPQRRAPSPDSGSDRPESDDPWDKAVNELVDMGFTSENSRRALTESGAGLNIQAAVGWLLNDAHQQAKEKAQGRSGTSQARDTSRGAGSLRPTDEGENEAIPTWARRGDAGRSSSQPRRSDSRSPAISESDVAKKAAAAGANFLKSANSLWGKTQKKVQRAVADFQQDGEVDPSQPKWMRDVVEQQRRPPRQAAQEDGSDLPRKSDAPTPSVTDEALALEMGSGPPPRKSARATPEGRGPPPSSRFPPSGLPPSSSSSRDQSPAMRTTESGRSTPLARWQQSAPPMDARTRMRMQVEEESAQAYVSSARRKKATPSPQPPSLAHEPDLLYGDGPGLASRSQQMPDFSRAAQPSRPASSGPRTPTPSAPLQIRPKTTQRRLPPVDPSSLAAAHKHRLAGTAHFKRGDYAAAHESYSSSLSQLPPTHPLTIILLTNHALTALKTGEPKTAVADADRALELIGTSQGNGETIDVQGQEKQMKEFYGKALMRKAEALENMERWKEAGEVWRTTVESGVGGATAIQGRQRCEKALAPKPAPRPAATRSPPKPKPASNGLTSLGEPDSEAVIRMRKANAAAEAADDEKFALSDSVDARIAAWRNGREGNLRALLGAMDQVLWEGSGWKKVGLHELVLTGKVKVNYMKAIGKTHPDKVRLLTSKPGGKEGGGEVGGGQQSSKDDR